MKICYLLKNTVYSLVLSLGLISCLTTKKLNKTPSIHYAPPGCIQIQPNFYCDEFEINNFSWLVYLGDLRRVFGENSEEYIDALPDQNVWLKVPSPCLRLAELYLGNPRYRDYPVVGITQDQAKKFAKWRSDSVFELNLIRARAIKLVASQNRENVFTIERYFRNELDYIVQKKKVDYYPEYYLPSKEERMQIEKYNDSVLRENKNLRVYIIENYDGTILCDSTLMLPTFPVYFFGRAKKALLLYGLFGNVAEWLSEDGLTAGGSWNDLDRSQFQNIKKVEVTRDAYTGFRCVARWKKWE